MQSDMGQNTAMGALLSNITGYANTATGVLALTSNTTGDSNSPFPHYAPYSNTKWGGNAAAGSDKEPT